MKKFISILTVELMFTAICVAQVRYLSINKDVHNATGQEAHGLKIVLKGQPIVLQRFDGVQNENHFGDCNENVDVENDKTILWWHDPRGENNDPKPIPHCEWVHIGYRLNLPAGILEFYWTDESGARIGDVMPQTKQEVIFNPSDPNLKLKITNTLQSDMSVSFELVGYAVVDQEIPLNELNAANPIFNNLTPFAGASGNTQLTSGSSESFDIPRNTDPDKPETHAIYLKKVINGGNGNTVVFTDYGQYGPVPWYDIVIIPEDNPTVSQWGLIIIAVLLVSAGTIAIWRRRQVAT